MRVAAWNGTPEQLARLEAAVRHNCGCVEVGGRLQVCEAHRMLSDQRVLDHLAFVASGVADYIHGEFDPVGEWF